MDELRSSLLFYSQARIQAREIWAQGWGGKCGECRKSGNVSPVVSRELSFHSPRFRRVKPTPLAPPPALPPSILLHTFLPSQERCGIVKVSVGTEKREEREFSYIQPPVLLWPQCPNARIPQGRELCCRINLIPMNQILHKSLNQFRSS